MLDAVKWGEWEALTPGSRKESKLLRLQIFPLPKFSAYQLYGLQAFQPPSFMASKLASLQASSLLND